MGKSSRCLVFILALIVVAGCEPEEMINPTLTSFTVETTEGLVEGQIDEQEGTVLLRHIPASEAIISIQAEADPQSTIVSELQNLQAAPVVTITLSRGECRRDYSLLFPDFVADNDSFRPSADKYSLEWSEEFSLDSIDRKVWSNIKSSSEACYKYMVSSDTVTYIRNGQLHLMAVNEPDPWKNFAFFYTGGLYSKDQKYFYMGRMDVRSRKDYAESFWPAIWMVGDKASTINGEIDLMEQLNHYTWFRQTAHTKKGMYCKDIKIKADEFHVYSVEITDEALNYYVDNELTFSYKNDGAGEKSYPFNLQNYYMILSAQLGDGGAWVGAPTGIDLPAGMYVDFVRYYKLRQ